MCIRFLYKGKRVHIGTLCKTAVIHKWYNNCPKNLFPDGAFDFQQDDTSFRKPKVQKRRCQIVKLPH